MKPDGIYLKRGGAWVTVMHFKMSHANMEEEEGVCPELLRRQGDATRGNYFIM